MEIVIVLRLLWRRRVAVACGIALAIAGALAVGTDPVPPSATAETRVTVDTPHSQLVTSAPAGADSLPWRATLLAIMLGDNHARTRIAREAGVPPDRLDVVDPELGEPAVPASLPHTAAQVAADVHEPYRITVHTDDVLPVVAVATEAPDRATAVRLARAAVDALGAHAPQHDTKVLQGLRVERVSPIQAKTVPGGGGRMRLLLVAVVLLVLWCAVLAVLPALRRGLRGLRPRRTAVS